VRYENALHIPDNNVSDNLTAIIQEKEIEKAGEIRPFLLSAFCQFIALVYPGNQSAHIHPPEIINRPADLVPPRMTPPAERD